MSGHRFWSRSAFPGWGSLCVCVWVRVLPALHFFLAWVLECVASCVCRVCFPPSSGGAACGVVVCGGCLGWDLSPLLPFCFFSGPRGVCGFGPCRVIALWCPPLRVLLFGLLGSVPRPLSFGLHPCFFFCPRLLQSGVCQRVRGYQFLGWAAALSWVSPGLAERSSGVLSGGPVFGVAFGVAWQGELPASCGVDAPLRGCVSVSCPPPFFSFSSVLFVCFPFFSGGGLPVHPSAFPGLVYALVATWCG